VTEVHFQMPNHLDDVDPMVVALASEVEEVLPMEARFRFELTVSEALTNLVIHAKTDCENAVIAIRLTLGKSDVEIAICDPAGAAPFDIRAHAPDLSQLDPTSEGGRGLGLIMECADRVDYAPCGPDDRNCLQLYFAPRP
jgi:serine/threonine-protein kinase RsbW